MRFLILLLALLLEKALQFLVVQNFELGESLSLIPSFFSIRYVLNTGAAWSFLANVSWGQSLLALLSSLVSLLLLYFLWACKDRWLTYLLSFFLAGSISNGLDRLFREGVVDYLSFQFGSYYFPVFNLADVYLVCSISLFLLLMFFVPRYKNLRLEETFRLPSWLRRSK